MSSLADLIEATARCFARYENLPAAPSVLAAVSGGVDSSALALVLARLASAQRLPGPLILAHVDHRQHARSAAALHHVASLAHRLGAGFASRTLEDLSPGASEDAMRQHRYQAFAAMAKECDAGFVVTAHHADDDVETVLFRMLRGTGVRGLAGIPEHREIGPRLHLLRPFLGVRRATLVQVVSDERLAVHVDPTNANPRYARNALRQQVIPALRASGSPDLVANLSAIAHGAKVVTDLVDAQARRILTQRCRQASAWRVELDLRELRAEDEPFLREALRQLDARLRPQGSPSPTPVLDRVLRELWRAPCGRRVHGKGTDALLFERTHQGLLIVQPGMAGAVPDDPVPLPLGTSVAFGASGYVVTTTRHDAPPLAPSPSDAGVYRALIDASAAPTPWAMRRRHSGDRLAPFGLRREVALRRFMQARHIPRFDRDRVPLVLDHQGRILWVPGADIAQAVALSLRATACVELQLSRP